MFYNNLKLVCDEKGLKITPIVLECGGTKGVIGGWKKGAMPNSDIVMKLSVRLNVPTDKLLFGKELFSSTSKLSVDEQNLIKSFNKLSERSKGKLIERAEMLLELETPEVLEPAITYIDLYDMPVSAGTGVDLSGYYKEELKVKRSSEAEQADFCLRISGNSMEPDYHDGDIILVKGRPTIQIGEIGVFVVNGSGYIKELGKNKLISLNDEYDDIILTENDSVWCMGEVIATLEDDDILG